MNTVYSAFGASGEIRAAKDLIFGWQILMIVGGFSHEWHPLELKYGCPFTSKQLEALLEVFIGPTYPDELRSTLVKAINEQRDHEGWERARVDAEMAEAEAEAVAPVDMALQEAQAEIKKLRYNQRRGLSRLAIAYLHRLQLNPRLTSNVRITRIIAFLQDMAFDLELREHGPAGRFLTPDDCPVTVKKPNSQELIELLDGFIPFSK